MFRTQRSILGHIAPGLAHKPYRCAIDRFAATGPEESVVHGSGILETHEEPCQTDKGKSDVVWKLVDISRRSRTLTPAEIPQESGFTFLMFHV